VKNTSPSSCSCAPCWNFTKRDLNRTGWYCISYSQDSSEGIFWGPRLFRRDCGYLDLTCVFWGSLNSLTAIPHYRTMCWKYQGWLGVNATAHKNPQYFPQLPSDHYR
jgi:hypothetical protein